MDLQVGVKVLLRNEEGKVLLLKRAEEKYGKLQGMWDIVGGRIDPGTSLIENLEREVREETGLAITSNPRLIAAQDIIIPGKERHVVRLTYTAHTDGEPVLDTSENGSYRWHSFEELRAAPDLDRYVRELLDSGLLSPDSWS
jgi:8-oxo-dGTP pyrophosphatase MutT (NUDIX family)